MRRLFALPRRRGLLALSLGLWVLAGLAAAFVLWTGPPAERLPDATAPAAARRPGLALHDAPSPVPAFMFADAQGNSLGVADFQDRVVLLNLWATWCVPCREEMPALDRLQAELGGPAFEVVALSIDRGGLDAVRGFFDEIGIVHLGIYLDPSSASTRVLGIPGIPTTLLIDLDGREIGRVTGPLEWDSPAIVNLIRRSITQSTASGTSRSAAAELKETN